MSDADTDKQRVRTGHANAALHLTARKLTIAQRALIRIGAGQDAESARIATTALHELQGMVGMVGQR